LHLLLIEISCMNIPESVNIDGGDGTVVMSNPGSIGHGISTSKKAIRDSPGFMTLAHFYSGIVSGILDL
jgi:hypothetical protein